MLSYLTLFFLYSFIGWIIYTSYRSITERRYNSGSFLPFLTPIYGFGGILLNLFFQVELPIFFHILLGTALIILLEFLGGIFCVAIFKKRYWNYSQNAYNFFGHIDLVHSVYWLLLVILFRMLFPFLPL